MVIRKLGPSILSFALNALSALGIASCGSRTSLADLEPCFATGETRTCQNNCGVGTQTCQEGFWQLCDVIPKSRACSNNCGTGTQTCANNDWGECAVETTSRTCANNCSSGTQECINNTWQACIVPVAASGCTNNCGSGTKTCSNNQWGDCNVGHQEAACSSVCGVGKQTCDNNTWTACDAPQPLPPQLQSTIRDFRNGVPSDFDRPDITKPVDDRGFVQSVLGADDTPTYALPGASITVQGPQTFAEWYHDVSGVNESTTIELPLAAATGQPDLFIYRNDAFFPIDGQLFGNQGLMHNYSFTLATSAHFTYQGSETFTFTGDDDVFVFINRHLAIDLGGVHDAETASVDLAAHADEFEITPGNRYPIHIFFAERHPFHSDFMVETSIADIGSCP